MVPSWAIHNPDGAEEKKKNAPLLKCPRCDSTNTKFCYFNNYSRAQPRHFCRACCRYWTEGGTLRNVPIGGVRKNKRRKIAPIENSSFAVSAGNPTPNIGLAAKGELEHPDTLSQVLHSLPASLKLPAVYTVDELICAPMPHISQTFMEDFSGGFVCSGGSSPFGAASSYSSSSQYSYRGRDVVGGYEDSFLGMMNPSTDISLVKEQALLPESNWIFWHDAADIADPGDGNSWIKEDTALPASYWNFWHDAAKYTGAGDV